jgi:hypothetical protein
VDKFVKRNECFNEKFSKDYQAYHLQDGCLTINELKTNDDINTNENVKRWRKA